MVTNVESPRLVREKVKRYASAASLIGERCKAARKSVGYTQLQLGMSMNEYLFERGQKGDWNSESKVSRLEGDSPESATLTPFEIMGLAHILRTSQAWLLGWDFRDPSFPWDALSKRETGRLFLEHLAAMVEGAREFIGWAEFIPCSLETANFMAAHHKKLFRRGSRDLPIEFLSTALQNYNEIGNERRAVLLGGPVRRSWTFIHLMFEGDLQAIADGTAVYSGIPAQLRRDCLSNLRRLMESTEHKISVLVIPDDPELRNRLRPYDAVVCVDDRFSFWRDPLGTVYSSTHRGMVQAKAALIANVRAKATVNGSQYLEKLAATVE